MRTNAGRSSMHKQHHPKPSDPAKQPLALHEHHMLKPRTRTCAVHAILHVWVKALCHSCSALTVHTLLSTASNATAPTAALHSAKHTPYCLPYPPECSMMLPTSHVRTPAAQRAKYQHHNPRLVATESRSRYRPPALVPNCSLMLFTSRNRRATCFTPTSTLATYCSRTRPPTYCNRTRILPASCTAAKVQQNAIHQPQPQPNMLHPNITT
jgi:hypothetical protein